MRSPAEQIIQRHAEGTGVEAGSREQGEIGVDDLLDSQREDVILVRWSASANVSRWRQAMDSQPYLGPRHRGGAGDMMMDGVSPAPQETRPLILSRPSALALHGRAISGVTDARLGAGRVGTSG